VTIDGTRPGRSGGAFLQAGDWRDAVLPSKVRNKPAAMDSNCRKLIFAFA